MNDIERDCLRRFCGSLQTRLGERLVEVQLFGSAARGDMWPASSPMHSDIDLLVITRDVVSQHDQEQLLNDTYPLYLECGRQLSPQFISRRRLVDPQDAPTRRFLRDVEADAVCVWPPPDGAGQ